MKPRHSIICILIVVLLPSGCTKSENEPDPSFTEDVEDITTTENITPYGGELQVTDEKGNTLSLTFPPGALRDTVSVTLTIIGKSKELPVDQRQMRTFKVQPADMILYRPAVFSIRYAEHVDEMAMYAIYRLRTDEWLAPLDNHVYSESEQTIEASTEILGEFTEGSMTLEQINTQLENFASYTGTTWKSAAVTQRDAYGQSSGCEEYKALWDDWAETAVAFLKFFQMRDLLGYYNNLPPGQRTLQEDVDKVCTNIYEQGVKAVLGLGEPADPCCSDYAEAVESMMHAMTWCVNQSTTFDQLNSRYNDVHSACHTYLDVTTEVSIEGGGLLIMTSGEVILNLEGTGNGEATVTGTGELVVTGSGDAGGQCSATISGQTFSSVSGTRDAAYIYSLALDMNQVAVMSTVCPDRVIETPLVGGSSRELTLGPGNGFSISETEAIDEGTVTVQITLQNPYIPVPDPQ